MSIVKKNFIFICIFIFLSNCQNMSDFKKAMTGQKVNTTDEFLIKKKDPLILPPQYDKLPLTKGDSFQEKKENRLAPEDGNPPLVRGMSQTIVSSTKYLSDLLAVLSPR